MPDLGILEGLLLPKLAVNRALVGADIENRAAQRGRQIFLVRIALDGGHDETRAALGLRDRPWVRRPR